MARKVVIYGGSGGIGSAIARILHVRGYELHLVGRTENTLSTIANELNATFTVGDINDSALFSRVTKNVGPSLDGLVYAIGTINLRSFTRHTEDDFINDFRINAMGAALAIQSALPALKKSTEIASIVLFSSIAALQGFAFHGSIAMAKGAINGLTLALANELSPRIRVNAIAPSLTRTPLANELLSNSKTEAAIAELHALQRLGTPEDIAALAVFLLSPEADWITGQIISVDGGRSTLRTKG
ncbi:SDR family NAD(P)-dependent oxidoreductase [Plesiomonas shigelloides]|uniref:SDR family NAD(P)-dependent oxidoreductase n=1 Tax=Plesiomonas shigelloides TaxID=703 RepID=UPI001C5BA17A|nr:SDR family oxidoreductase [Plesiomonas shigelloides]MBW3794019.1 SDR family oxidoreductase [Plesiomonas shigelloides]